MPRAFRILDVFAREGERFSGNPLAVFEDGDGLDDHSMQALARQFNLSETTFLLPPRHRDASARVRIFTPTFEMPFAGHPTLGTAHVARSLCGGIDRVVLEMHAGLVEVGLAGDLATLRAPRAARTREPRASPAEFAATLGLPREAIAGPPLFVDTGVEQLVIPLASADDVRRANADPALLARHGFCESRGESMAYVFAPPDAGATLVRFFFMEHASVVEDPATGSACANLGGYLSATQPGRTFDLRLDQGEAVARPSRLHLRVDETGAIHVAGLVRERGRGVMNDD